MVLSKLEIALGEGLWVRCSCRYDVLDRLVIACIVHLFESVDSVDRLALEYAFVYLGETFFVLLFDHGRQIWLALQLSLYI